VDSPSWLETDALLMQFSDRIVEARARYAQFVAESIGAATPWEHLQGQIYECDEIRATDADIPRSLVQGSQYPEASTKSPGTL
jgi:hypothetical protein